jgi:ATP adenylyltransferase
MLTLVTSNSAKYTPFALDLERMRIALEPPTQPLIEIHTSDFEKALCAKAKAAATMFGRPVLVDDAGLVMEAYGGFPGPLTSAVLDRVGPAGLARLLSGISSRGAMECHIGCWLNGSLRRWSGRAPGTLDLSRVQPGADGRLNPQAPPRMLLSEAFVPDDPGRPGLLLHRARALAALEHDAFGLHLEMDRQPRAGDSLLAAEPSAGTCFSCPFCAEFEEDGVNTFAALMGQRLASRIVYEDEYFVVMPPLGEFIEGGLLLLSRAHILSFAHLPAELFPRLERLVSAVCQAVSQRWGVSPLVFEHGPATERSKGVCCVDHAHFNIFPARVFVHTHLAGRMHSPLQSLSELQRLREAEFGYLFVQENKGERRVYDGSNVPTQLVRRIITKELAMPERWHWRDYLGQDELIATFEALKGQIRV